MISKQEFVCFFGTPASGRVLRQRPRGMFGPIVQNRIDDRPGHLYLVAAGEESWIPDHAVEQQRLVRGMCVVAERLRISKVHVDGRDLQTRSQLVHCSWCLDLEPQRDSLIWLNAQRQHTGRHILNGFLTEKKERRRPELNCDL